MKKRTWFILGLLVCMMCFMACGKNKGTVSETESTSKKADETITAPTEKESTSQVPTYVEMADVRNNFGYFVEVDDKVYYRVYGQDAFENPVIFGQFLNNTTGGESDFYCYDKKDKSNTKLFTDCGYGEMVYMNEVFYMNGKKDVGRGYNESYVYAIDMNGKSIALEDEYAGEIVGVTDSNDLIFINGSWYEGQDYKGEFLIGLDANGKKVIDIKLEGVVEYLGSFQDHIVFTQNKYDESFLKLWCLYLPNGGQTYEPVLMGEVDKSAYENSLWGLQLVASDMLDEEYATFYSSVGSGHMFYGGVIVSFKPWEEGSAKVVQTISDSEFYNMPYMELDGNKICLYEKKANSYYIDQKGFDNPGNLCYVGNFGEKRMVIPDFIEGADYYEVRGDLCHAERVDNDDFVMSMIMVYDSEGSIGWRDGFRLLKMQYIKVDGDTNQVEVLSEVSYTED